MRYTRVLPVTNRKYRVTVSTQAVADFSPAANAGPDSPSYVEFVAGKIEFRNDAGGIVHAPVGRRSFEENQLVENVQAFVSHIEKLRPNSIKGVYMKKVFIKSTMSPSVAVQLAQ